MSLTAACFGLFNPVISLYPSTQVYSTALPIVDKHGIPLDNAFRCIHFIGYILEHASNCSYWS